MHHDEVHRLAVEEAGYQQLVAGDEVGLAGDHRPIRLGTGHREILGVVEHGHIHATPVRRVVVYDLVVACGDLGLGHQVLKHMAVLDFRETENGNAIGGIVQSDGRDGIRHVVQFGHVFLCVPLVGPIGQELLVVRERVVDGVEEVFQVVEADQADLVCVLFLGDGGFQVEE